MKYIPKNASLIMNKEFLYKYWNFWIVKTPSRRPVASTTCNGIGLNWNKTNITAFCFKACHLRDANITVYDKTLQL